MRQITGRWRLLPVVMAALLFAVGVLALFHSEIGMTNEIGVEGPPLSSYDFSVIPQSVIDDAASVARDLVGQGQKSYQELVDQLLATYLEARDKQVVVVFNPGGWGWNPLDTTPGWSSILDGIKNELADLGYSSLVLNYRRTSGGIVACVREAIEALTHYPTKAKLLARRIDFLTGEFPEVRVIVAGESIGTIFTDSTMNMLQDNPRVYSIQTGTPFWYKTTGGDRTLRMNSNGKTADTFSDGKVGSMVWATVAGWFGVNSGDDGSGRILSWLRAPGHDYSWRYPEVCGEIVNFLQDNFGANREIN